MKKLLLIGLLAGLTTTFLCCYADIINYKAKQIIQKQDIGRSDMDKVIKTLKNDNYSIQHKIVTLHHFLKDIGCEKVHPDFNMVVKILSLAKKNNIEPQSLKYVFTPKGKIYIDETCEILKLMSDAHQMTDDEIKFVFSYSYKKSDIFTIYQEEKSSNRKILNYTTLRKKYENSVIIPLGTKNNKKGEELK